MNSDGTETIIKNNCQNALNKLQWHSGTLLQVLKHDCGFWVLDINLPEVSYTYNSETIMPKNKDRYHVVRKNDIIMFLGLVKTKVSNDKKEYHVLQFLYKDVILFWDYRLICNVANFLESKFKKISN